MVQRLTATALVPLSIWFLIFVLSLLGSDYVAATEAVAKPWNAILLVGFLIAAFWHAQLGMQVVLEDYVHTSLAGPGRADHRALRRRARRHRQHLRRGAHRAGHRLIHRRPL